MELKQFSAANMMMSLPLFKVYLAEESGGKH